MTLRTFAIFIYIFFATKQTYHLCRCTATAAPFSPVSTFSLSCLHLLPACVIAFFLPALRCKLIPFLSYKARLCAQNIIVRRPSAALPTAVTPCVRRPSSMLPTAAAHSALHAQPATTGTQTPQQYTANCRLLYAAPSAIFLTIIHSYSKREGIQSSLPSAIFFTIIHHHTLRSTAQKALSAHFCIKKRIFHTVVSFYLRTFAPAIAPVAELVDALDLGSSFSRSAGSIPVRRTHTGIMYELQRHRKVPQLVHLFL